MVCSRAENSAMTLLLLTGKMEKGGEKRRWSGQGLELSIAPQLLPSLHGSIVNF